jgi:Uma2 family endonuclease
MATVRTAQALPTTEYVERDLGRLPDRPSSLLTLEQFKRLVKDGMKADLINGVMFVTIPASYTHERLFGFLMRLVGDYVEAKDLGVILGSRSLVEVGPRDGYEPDLCFVAQNRLDIINEASITGPPDLVIEIISPSTRRHDAYAKKQGYARLGVPEYWLIDPDNRAVVFYRLTESGYVEDPVEDGVYHSLAVPGLWLRLDWLWDHPKVADCLRELGVL